MTRRLRLAVLPSLVLTLAWLAMAPSVAARGALPLPACRGIVGTYLATVFNDGAFASRNLLSFTNGGVFLVTDSGQSGQVGAFAPFSNSQGSWRCVSRRRGTVEVVATALNFTFPDDPAQQTIGRADYRITVDLGMNELSGMIDLYFVALGDDPYAPDLIPIAMFTLDGTAIGADAPPAQ